MHKGKTKGNINTQWILFSLKEGNSLTYYNMDESWEHYAKWNKPVTEDKYCMTSFMWGI